MTRPLRIKFKLNLQRCGYTTFGVSKRTLAALHSAVKVAPKDAHPSQVAHHPPPSRAHSERAFRLVQCFVDG